MAGLKVLRRIQLGAERSAAGTLDTISALWRGVGTLEDQRTVVFTPEDVGFLPGIDRQYQPRYLGVLALEATPCTFQQILHLMESGIKLVTTGTTDTGGSGKVYTYDMATTTANTLKTYSIEAGDNQQAQYMTYGFCRSFTLAGRAGEALMMSAEMVGRQVATTTFTAAPSLPTVEEVLVSKGKVYIDGTTMGTTQVTSTILGVNLAVNTGQREVFTADGNLYFTFTKSVMPEVVLDLTMEHNGTAVTEIAAWRAGTARAIRMLFEGSGLTTAGTFTNYTVRASMWGKWENFSKIGEQDGNDITTGRFRARYNNTASAFTSFVVVNQMATSG